MLTARQIKSLTIIHTSPMYCKPGEVAYWIAGTTNHREFIKEDFIADVKRLLPVESEEILTFYGEVLK